VNLLSDRGHYPVASTLGYGKRLFDHEKRETLFDFKARKNSSTYILIQIDPGPGSYRNPSEFGHYDGNVYKNTGGIAYMSRTSQLKSLNTSVRSSRSRL
jgi:hypothetical protein